MARGFSVTETIKRPSAEVWAYLIDFNNHASDWMDGIDDMIQLTPGKIEIGTGFNFNARGKMHQTEVTAYAETGNEKLIALTSNQGGIAATYTYRVVPASETETTMHLDVVCQASGLWILIRPLIAIAMKRSDGGQLTNIKKAIQQS